jgi:CRP/FNR family cyclic AMP-dependent transcriptional regulator
MLLPELLATVPLFRGLTSAELAELAPRLVESRAQPEEPIIREGDPPGHPIYLLLKGSVEIVKAGVDLRSRVIASLSAPSLFGEIEVLARRPATAGVIALSECELALLPRSVFDDLTSASRDGVLKVVKNLAAILSYRLATTDERLAAYFDIGEEAARTCIGEARSAIYSGTGPP